MTTYNQWAALASNALDAARTFIGTEREYQAEQAELNGNAGPVPAPIPDDEPLPAPTPLSARQAKTRRAVERLIGTTLT